MATNYNLMEVTCQRSVGDAAFSQGNQQFNFTIGRPNAWCPNRSYFKIDLKLEGNGTANPIPRVSDQISLADNCAGNLYTNCFFKAGGQDVSAITSFMPQASALKKRLNRAHPWLQSIGKPTNFDIASQVSRIYQLSTSVRGDNGDGSTAYMLKGCADANYATVNVEIAAATGVVTSTVAATLWNSPSTALADTQLYVGDILVVRGQKYTVSAITDDTHVLVQPTTAIAIAATTDFYFIRPNVRNTTVSKNVISVIWQPSIGIMDYDGWLGAGDYQFTLTPDSNYLLNAVETRNSGLYNSALNSVVANKINLSIQNVKLYVQQCKLDIPEGPQALSLIESLIMSKPISSSNSVSNLQFSVPPSTQYISVFVQSNQAGSSNLFPPSMFKALPSGVNVADFNNLSGDLTLSTIQLTYGSINKPSTNWSSALSTTGGGAISVAAAPVAVGSNNQTASQTNQMVQRFYDSYLEMNNKANMPEGSETMDEFLQRGPFYHFMFERDSSDRSTELQLNIGYSNISTASNVYVCAWYHNTVNYTVSNGLITALSTRQV